MSFDHIFTHRGAVLPFQKYHTHSPHQPAKVGQPRYDSRALRSYLCDSDDCCGCMWVRERVGMCVQGGCLVLGSSAKFCCWRRTTTHGSTPRPGRSATTASSRRSTIKVHPDVSGVLHLRSSIPPPKTGFGRNQITSRCIIPCRKHTKT